LFFNIQAASHFFDATASSRSFFVLLDELERRFFEEPGPLQ
jgi:hypothetical protein